MRGVVLGVKAVFLIALIISISFFNTGKVSAEEEEQNVCCEKTSSGDTCVYTAESNCDSDSLQASISCEQTAFCKAGCCVSDEGKCSKGVAQSTCDNLEGFSWYDDTTCDSISSCEKNCCVIAESQCAYTTEAHCEVLIKDLEDITLDWRDVDSESACTDICKAADKGCCVTGEGCTYDTYAMCEEPDIDLTANTGFYEETFCSEFEEFCGCAPGDSKACVDEDVYSFDSCGNQEEKVEDCDYTQGTWCGTDSNGEIGCLSTDCGSTFDGKYQINLEGDEVLRNTHDTNKIGGPRSNGESWCLYESPAGGFKDFPGSQHYRAYCYFGEEIIEPCADYREEVCIQVPYTSYKGFDSFGEIIEEDYSGDYAGPTGSACIDNTDNTIFNTNVTTVSVGKDWDDSSLVETCAVANVECQQSYAKDSWTDPSFQVGQGVMCSSPQWAKAMHEYCRSKGDCGNSMGLVEKFSSEGFYMSSSADFLTAKDDKNTSYKVFVGYDYCVDRFIGGEYEGDAEYGDLLSFGDNKFIDQIEEVNKLEQEAVYCLYECKEKIADKNEDGIREDVDDGGYSDNCRFIKTIDENFYDTFYSGDYGEYYQKLSVIEEGEDLIVHGSFPKISFEEDMGKESYGVYGGLIAVSSLMYENTELSEIAGSLGWVIGLGVGSIVGSLSYAGTLVVFGAKTIAATGASAISKEAVKSMTLEIAKEIGAESGAVFAKETVGSIALGIGGLVVLVTTLWSWAKVASVENPIERSQQMHGFAIASTIGGSVLAISMTIAAVAGTGGPIGWAVSIVALLVVAVAAITSYGGEVRDVTISSHCEAWQPPQGGDYCNLCDTPVSEGGLAIDDGEGHILTGWECTEYKCKSLGQNCAYISENSGTNRPKCIAENVNDVNRPIIKAYMLDVSEEMNAKGVEDTYDYVTESAGAEFSANDGTSSSGYLKIDQDIWPYQYFTFGIETDEPSQCKITQTVPETFDDLDQYFPDSYYDYQHNQTWVLVSNTTYNFYIVCQDHQGNGASPPVFFEVHVETDEGEDVTPPSIEATNIKNGGYVPAGVNETALSIYLDGPVEGCRWSTIDQEYNLMEWPFICPGVPDSASAYFENDCSTVLNVTQETNNYYLACIDASGNANTENYPFTLLATAPLNIDLVSPTGTLYTDTTTLAVQTSVGAENGKAICSYDGINFFETNSSIHKQSLEDLAAGDYNFDIFCSDVAGNQETSNINFTVEVDITAPELLSIYKQENIVYYTLDEEANCEYYFEDFNYGSGTSISTGSTSGSLSLTEIKEYYLKCEDIFGNEGSWTVRV